MSAEHDQLIRKGASAIDEQLERFADREFAEKSFTESCREIETILQDGLAEYSEKDHIRVMAIVIAGRLLRHDALQIQNQGVFSDRAFDEGN